MERREEILVVSGGEGAERDVSLHSGHAVCEALRSWGASVRLVDVHSLQEVPKIARGTDTCVFIALHGGWGEDGRLQVLLESERRLYTGSGPRACMLAMDKWASKALFRQSGIPVPDGICAPTAPSGGILASVQALLARVGKIVVKPRSCGSTVGFSIVTEESGLNEALALVSRFEEEAMIEEFIEGDELAVTILDVPGDVRALPPVMIRPKKGIYDYESKYTAGATEYLSPPPLPDALLGEIRDTAFAAHRALGCAVFSRVDMRLDPHGNLKVLEVNAVPGMTATSLVPKAAAAASIAFGDLLGRIVDASVEVRKREWRDGR